MASYKESQIRLLNRTLPFDEDKAILFIRGQTQDLIPRETTCEGKEEKTTDSSTNHDLSQLGEEIKDFYDQVIQSVSSNKVDSIQHTSPPCTCKLKTTSKTTTISPTVTEIDMFKFAQEGNLDDLQRGLSFGHDINIRDNYDWSLLMCASCAGHMTLVTYLLENGALWRGVVDRRGFDAAMIANRSGNYDIAEVIRSFKMKTKEMESHDLSEVSSFYCDICKREVTSELLHEHNVSTLHQFNCQHATGQTPYSLSTKNRGFQMMLQSGWDPTRGLGSDGQGHQYPIKTILKRDRNGLGSSSKQSPRVTHFAAGDVSAVKNIRWQQMRKKDATKKERKKLLQKERRWEIELRTYMNSDY